ncbi:MULTISPECIES: hypothetical protein [Lysinibacillus]|uniref:Uncharacterized protein n=1 Tax=Lysinibacillus antri TaxID=2498145 RepID=A0A432LFA9_9BACI|nr:MULTISPECIES: hypothetical protein [Lysinibacillus]RUL55099.1 hypothetical protein EK386_05065 [Lysinibacillus antri]TSI10101.1 hypothetical protein FJQ64_04330 [Lysinibacillus sp. BW-2-10]
MFRSILIIQFAVILAISFISGVVCFQLFPLDKAMQLIGYIDPRVLDVQDISILGTIAPLVIWVLLVLFFATHPYLHVLARLVVAVKATFFGFSSVFLLTQQESLLIYSVWWFPFQLVYCFLLFLLCSVYASKKVGGNRKYFFAQKLFVTLVVMLIIICVGENVVINYIL